MALRAKRHSQRLNRKTPIEHTGFFRYLQHYLQACQLKGYSEQTVSRHDNHNRRFIAWCDERGINEPSEVTKPILERYRRHLYYYRKTDGEPLSFNSQQVMLSSVKGYFRWLTRENHLLYNPASELELPKPPRRLPRTILSVEDVAAILSGPNVHTAAGIRDRTIIECFYATGIRRSELATLKEYDIDLKRKALMIRSGKGGKDRVLPLGDRLIEWLKRYLDQGREPLRSPLDDDRLFITDYGEPFTGGHLGRLIKGYMLKAGIEVIGSCHLFRHAMATHMLDNGADIRFIQAMLGHEDLTSTQLYTRVSIEKLRQIHQATHPMSQSDTQDRD